MGDLLGYARVSTIEQNRLQTDALKDAGCIRVWTDKASGTLDHRPPVIIGYCQGHLYDLAGYVAWLVADSFEAENNGPRALKAIDTALQHGARDPRLTLAHARRLAAQRQDKRLRAVVETALEVRNTDPAWADLADWYNLYQGQQARRVHLPGPRPWRLHSSRATGRQSRSPAFQLLSRGLTPHASRTPERVQDPLALRA
jgi:hypothetical protein